VRKTRAFNVDEIDVQVAKNEWETLRMFSSAFFGRVKCYHYITIEEGNIEYGNIENCNIEFNAK